MSTQPPIRQTDLRAAHTAIQAELDAAWHRVLQSGRYILGPEVEALEREFATYIGTAHGAATGSGTDAIHIALRALGVGPGDCVLTVAHTAVATAAAIVLCGARPIFVDIHRGDFTMDPHRLDAAIRRHRAEAAAGPIRAIVPVHLYGHPADMRAIREIADRHALPIVEDCAQAHGARIDSSRCGSFGNLAAFSFYPTKNLAACGDGGMIVSDDSALVERCRRLRQYGWDAARTSTEPGLNSRLDELQAALLRVKLRYLDSDNDRRRAVADAYDQSLGESTVEPPTVRPGAYHVYHQYVVRSSRRDALRGELSHAGIETAVHYAAAVHQHPAFAPYAPEPGELAETERAAREVLSLPMYPQLAQSDVARVADALRRSR